MTDSNDAQGLVAVEGKTLVMTFRGTDPKDPAVLSGQAFIGSSLAANYEAFAPMIAAAKDYLGAHPEIERVRGFGPQPRRRHGGHFRVDRAAEFRGIRPDGVPSCRSRHRAFRPISRNISTASTKAWRTSTTG